MAVAFPDWQKLGRVFGASAPVCKTLCLYIRGPIEIKEAAIFLPSGAPSSLATPGRAMKSGVLVLGSAETSGTLGNKSKGTSFALL